MVTAEVGARAQVHLAGLVVAVPTASRRIGQPGQCAVLVFDGPLVQERFAASVAEPTTARRLLALADGAPVLTDAPAACRELLRQAGIGQPLVWDVLELARLLVPACPTGSLERVAAFFDLAAQGSDPVAHASLLFDLFGVLLARLEQVETATLLHVGRLAAGLDWPLAALFRELERQRAKSALETGVLAEAAPIGAWITQGLPPARRAQQASAPDPQEAVLDPADVARRLGPDAPLAAAMPGYEARHEQVRMSELVTEALNDAARLLIEAGTGTGKSLAYLLPAALYAVRGGRRVVVSTATTTLQDQLFEQDLPLVEVALGAEPGGPLRACVLKGRANYLCLRRWQTLLQASDLGPGDRSLLIKTLFWLPQTRTGDRAELHLEPPEEDAWQRLAAVTEACTPLRCSYHRIGVCFLARARRAAEDSHIVIANHALLLTDMATRSRVLPHADALIIDEAHHLEDEATQQLGWRLGERELLGRLERLWTPGDAATGAIPEALAAIAAADPGGPQVPPSLLGELERGDLAMRQLLSQVRSFFEALSRLLEDRDLFSDGGPGGDDSALRITGAVRAGSAWQEIEEIWASATEHLQGVERLVTLVVAELDGLPGAPEAAHNLAAELNGQLDYWRDVRRRLHTAVHLPSSGAVHWISNGGGRARAAWLSAAPLDVSSLLRDRLFEAPETVILVSATLAIGGSFEYVKQRLGLDDASAAALGSPFDYAKAALLYVPNDLPDPNQPGYQASLERAILDVTSRLRGRTLVLFTSRAHLRATYYALHGPLAAQHVTLLGQGIDDSSRTRLLESFRRGAHVALFGTNAFWEGIDVVGEALSCVMVARLPFAVPTDPVYAARAEQFDEPFSQYAVPQAVLRLKQGVGRLIRSRSDRGAVIVLDRRLVTRTYGQVFLRSLPPCSTKQGAVGRTGIEVDDWLSPAVQPALQFALE